MKGTIVFLRNFANPIWVY